MVTSAVFCVEGESATCVSRRQLWMEITWLCFTILAVKTERKDYLAEICWRKSSKTSSWSGDESEGGYELALTLKTYA